MESDGYSLLDGSRVEPTELTLERTAKESMKPKYAFFMLLYTNLSQLLLNLQSRLQVRSSTARLNSLKPFCSVECCFTLSLIVREPAYYLLYATTNADTGFSTCAQVHSTIRASCQHIQQDSSFDVVSLALCALT